MKRFILRIALICLNALPGICAAHGAEAMNSNDEESADDLEIAALAESLYGEGNSSPPAQASELTAAPRQLPLQKHEVAIRIPPLGSRRLPAKPNAFLSLPERLNTYNAILQATLRDDRTAQRAMIRRFDQSTPLAKHEYIKLLRHIGTYETKRLGDKYQALTEALQGLTFVFQGRVFFPQQLSHLHPHLEETHRILNEVEKALQVDHAVLQKRLAECPWQENGVADLIAEFRFEIEDALELANEGERERALYQIAIPPTTVARPLLSLGDRWELTNGHDLAVYWAYRRLLVELISGMHSVASTQKALGRLRAVLSFSPSPSF